MKTFRYILSRTWIIILLLAFLLLFILFSLSNAVRSEQFVIEIGDGSEFISYLEPFGEAPQKQLMPVGVQLNDNQTYVLQFSFNVKWNYDEIHNFVPDLVGNMQLSIPVDGIFLVDQDLNRLDANEEFDLHSMILISFLAEGEDPENFEDAIEGAIKDFPISQMKPGDEIDTVYLRIRLATNMTEAQVNYIAGAKVGITFDFNIIPD